MKPIILDRSTLEQYATCPRQGFLNKLWEVVKAQAEGYEVFPHEIKMMEANKLETEAMQKAALQSKDNNNTECGVHIHALVEKAFKACNNDLSIVPQWFVDNLPTIQPNIQPMALRHARHIADMLSDLHVAIIGLEQQISLIIYPETETTPAVIATMRLDLLASGNNALHVIDWKTGYKKRSNTETADSFQAQAAAFLLFQQPQYKEVNLIHFWYYETMWGTKAYAKFERNAVHPRLPELTTEKAIKSRVVLAVDLCVKYCKDPWPLPESCAFCDVIKFCPYADIDAKEIADDPQAFIDRLIVFEALLKKKKTAATQWIKAKGELVGTKAKYTRKLPQERFTGAFIALNAAPEVEGDEE